MTDARGDAELCETEPMVSTTVHLVRHGEVHNPDKVLYGRLPDFHLSDLGAQMARRVGQWFLGDDGTRPKADIAVVIASPLERAQETAAPTAEAFGLEIGTDDRLIEAANHFEGTRIGVGPGALWRPRHWAALRNPFRPSWGEPYREIVDRMHAAVADARALALGREVVLVSHQLPVWEARLAYEGRRLWHDPRRRECTLASVTSLVFDADRLTAVRYCEPVADLLPGAARTAGA